MKIQQCLMEVTTGYVWLILLLDFQQQNMLHIFSSAMVGAMQNGVIKRKKLVNPTSLQFKSTIILQF